MNTTTNILDSLYNNNLSARPSFVDASTPVCVVDYVEDFEWLWDLKKSKHLTEGFERWLADRDGKDAAVVIGWDGMPSGSTDNNILRHVTPFDWALSISEGLLKRKPLPRLRIMVVDGFPNGFIGQFYGQGIFSIEMLETFKASMPWLGVGTLSECENVLKNLVSGTFDSFESLYSEGIRHQNQVRGLNYAWQGMTASTGEGHSINNVVGPLLLLGDPVQANPLVGALWRRMQLLTGLKREGDDDDSFLLTKDTSWIDWRADDWKKKLERLPGRKTKLKLLLLDDQWRDGWGEVICKAVGAEYTQEEIKELAPETEFRQIGLHQEQDICVKACDSAAWLLNENGPLANVADRRFSLRMDESDNESGQEILFLDLRLFSRKPVSEEAEFIEILLERVENIQNDRPEKLPWPGFNEDELQEVRLWIKEAKDSQSSDLRQHPSYHKALTLLPRLISLIDLSYPIILFSSTGRREIVEKFKEYGNIFTDFDKPRLTGALTRDVVSQSMAFFHHAMEQSLSFLNARNRCIAFVNWKDPYERVSKPVIQKDRAYHVEFYIDETDPEQHHDDRSFYRKGWRVGGCYALFDGDTEDEAREKANRFEDMMVQKGVRYFEWIYNGVQPKDIREKKAHVCHAHIQSAVISSQEAGCKPILLGIASLYQRVPEGREEDVDLLDPRHDDQLFLTTLDALVEAFLYESVPALTGDKTPSISLFAGSRINVIEDRKTGNNSINIASREQYRTGIGWKPHTTGGGMQDGVEQETFRKDGFSTIVRNVVRNREKRNIHRALAVHLPYAEKKQQPKTFVCRKCESTIVVNDREKEICNKQVDVGQVFQGTVTKHVSTGFILEIYPGVTGIVYESDALPTKKINIGGRYCGAVTRILQGGSVLVDFGADHWGRLPPRYVPADIGVGDPIDVRLIKKNFDKEKRRMMYELESYKGELETETVDSESAKDVMRLGSQHLVKVINKQSSRLRLSRVAALDISDSETANLTEPTKCLSCGSVDSVYPDCRALHYIADQILTDMFGNGRRRYESVFRHLIPGEFEEGWDEEFPKVLEASRALDIAPSDIPRAVAVFPLHANRRCVDPQGKKTKPTIRDRVRWRIGRSLVKISGKSFVNIVRGVVVE